MHLLLLLMVVIWGANYSLIKVVLRELPPLSTYRTDIGGGLDFDQFGIYLAKALSVPSEPLNVFIRVRHRF